MATENKAANLIPVEVASGQMVRCAEKKTLIRAGGIAMVPEAQYEESMGERKDGKAAKASKKAAKEEGVSDV